MSFRALPARALAAALRERFGRRVLGPTAPPVDRVRGEYLATLLLKADPQSRVAFTDLIYDLLKHDRKIDLSGLEV